MNTKSQHLRNQISRLIKTGFNKPQPGIEKQNNATQTELIRRDERKPAAVGVLHSKHKTIIGETPDGKGVSPIMRKIQY